MSRRIIQAMVCASEGDDPNDTNHTSHRTMTFTLRINNIKAQPTKIIDEGKGFEANKQSDSLLHYKKEETADEFKMDDDGAEEYVYRTPCGEEYTHFYTYTRDFNEECPNEPVDLGWRVEAVRGYMQNEQEQMSGWWKNLSTNSASDFTTAHLDFI